MAALYRRHTGCDYSHCNSTSVVAQRTAAKKDVGEAQELRFL